MCALHPYPAQRRRERTSPQIGELCEARPMPILSTVRCSANDAALHQRSAASCDAAPYTSDYTFEQIYYRSIREARATISSRRRLSLALGHRLVLVLEESGRAESRGCAGCYGRERLNSRIYTKIMRWNSRWRLDAAARPRCAACTRESVIQDVDIPLTRAAEFLDFFQREIGISAAVDLPDRHARAVGLLYPMDAEQDVREFRLLGRRAQAPTVRAGSLQPADRAQSASSSAASNRCTRTATSRREEFWSDLQRRAVSCSQAALRSAGRVQGPLRKMRASAARALPWQLTSSSSSGRSSIISAGAGLGVGIVALALALAARVDCAAYDPPSEADPATGDAICSAS